MRPFELEGLDDAGPGLVGVLAQESARFTTFGESMTGLLMPGGSVVRWRVGWDLAESHNALIQQMVDLDLGWIWIMGDDHVFSPDILAKLLRRNVDVVVPLCLMRAPPYRPVEFVADPTTTSGVRRLELGDYPDGGVVQVSAAGGAGMLIRRHVIDALGDPWFETGEGITNRVGEDINFCRKATAAGFEIWCDLDAVLGHSMTSSVWPVREHDGWTFAFSMVGGFHITMPPGFQRYADEVGA